MSDELHSHARSFASVAKAYDRARPSYPADAVRWLIGEHRLGGPLRVLELGAGTGLLTELVVAAGHDVLATDPLPEMLEQLHRRLPDTPTAVATAESIPAPSRSFDVVLCAQSFHWFEQPDAMNEIARVLAPGGILGLVWNVRDEGIPWVRKLGKIIGSSEAESKADLAGAARDSEYFGVVDSDEFRFWQTMRKDELFDLVRSRSYVAVMGEPERAALLDRVGALYDDYGRGPDGMQLPYLTKCFRTLVIGVPPARTTATAAAPVAATTATTGAPHDPDATEAIDLTGLPNAGPNAGPAATPPATPAARPAAPPEDPGTVLIDFS